MIPYMISRLHLPRIETLVSNSSSRNIAVVLVNGGCVMSKHLCLVSTLRDSCRLFGRIIGPWRSTADKSPQLPQYTATRWL